MAAALGLKRPDTVESEAGRAEWESRHAALARGYGLAISVQALGVLLSDYHTAQVPSSGTGRNRRTFPTRCDELTWLPRAKLNEYRQDAFATYALWARENAPHTLAELRDALQEPPLRALPGAQVLSASPTSAIRGLKSCNLLIY